MARRGFSKQDFEKSNERTQGKGDFPTIEKGVYVASIQRASIKDTQKGARQAAFGFQISPEDERFPSQYVWWNQTLQNTDGALNEIGMDSFNQMLYRLSEGHFDLDDFKFDKEGFCINENDVMEKFIDTEVKIFVEKVGEYQGQPNYKIKVQRVLTNTYCNGKTDKPQDDLDVEEVPVDTSPSVSPEASPKKEEDEDGEVEIQVGMAVIYVKGKTQKRARVETFVEGPNNTGVLQLKVTADDDDTFTQFTNEEQIIAKPTQILPVIDVPIISMSANPVPTPTEELDLEDEPSPSPSLKVGQTVSYPWEGKTLQAPIHSIDENTGTVVLVVTVDGKKKGRKISISDLIPF